MGAASRARSDIFSSGRTELNDPGDLAREQPPSAPLREPTARWPRLIALVVVLVGLYLAGKFSPLAVYMTREGVQSAVQRAGPWGYGLYVALFAVGALVQLPGWLFVAAACFSFGR